MDKLAHWQVEHNSAGELVVYDRILREGQEDLVPQVSQLAASSRSPLTQFEPNTGCLLYSSSSFSSKNKRQGHVLEPVVIPSSLENESPHVLCPVAALKCYIEAIPADSNDG